MKKVLLATILFVIYSTSAYSISFTFSGSNAGGTGAATMDISIIGNTLSLELNNTSPLPLDNGTGVNAPGITAFGFFLDNTPLPTLSSWNLNAKTLVGSDVLIGSSSGSGFLWDMKISQNNQGVTLDYLPYLQDVKGALYNPDQTSGFAALPNYFTTAYLDMTFAEAPTLETEAQSIGSGLEGITFVRMQNVGLNGGGSLKLPGIVDDGNGTGTGTNVVPEPSTWILLGGGLLGLAFYRRKKN